MVVRRRAQKRREQHRHQDHDDRDYDEQLDECETVASGLTMDRRYVPQLLDMIFQYIRRSVILRYYGG